MTWTRTDAVTALNTLLQVVEAAEPLTVEWPGSRLPPDSAEYVRPAMVAADGAWFRQAQEHGSGVYVVDIFVRPQVSGDAYRLHEIADILTEEFDGADLALGGGNMLRLKEGDFRDFGPDPTAPEYFHGQVRWEWFIVP